MVPGDVNEHVLQIDPARPVSEDTVKSRPRTVAPTGLFKRRSPFKLLNLLEERREELGERQKLLSSDGKLITEFTLINCIWLRDLLRLPLLVHVRNRVERSRTLENIFRLVIELP